MSVRYRPEREKWEAAIVVRGKRRRPLFDTKKEALDAEKKAKLQKFEIDDKSITRIPIADSFRMYFEDVSAGKTSTANDRIYFNLGNHFLTEVRGLEYVDEITLQDLEALQKWLAKEQVLEEGKVKVQWKATTVNRAFHTYDHFFNKMCAWGHLSKSPGQYLSSLTEEPVTREPLSLEMYQAIVAHPATTDWFKDVLEFIRDTGSRGSSIGRLSWPHVNLQERWFEIDMKKGAKAATKVIRLPMTDKVFALFVRIRNKWPLAEGAVFRYDNGQPVRADVISKAGSRTLRACGFKEVDLYGARHGLASDLINAGVPIEVVRQLLGHASTKTTQTYTKGTSMETLNNALRLVRGSEVPPDATSSITKVAVGSDDLE